jgi:hypothetical protein
MRAMRNISLAVLVVLVLTTAALGGPGGLGPKGGKPPAVTTPKKGQRFCPSSALVFGNIVIQPGRCYVLLTLHNSQGTFLAFAAPDTRIPPGQVVRMNTPAGAKLRGRIFYLVPIHTNVELVPVNTVTVVATRIEDSGPQLSITVVDTPVPNLTVIFNVRL